VITVSQEVTLASVAQFVKKPKYQVYDLLTRDGTEVFFKERDISITKLKRTQFFVREDEGSRFI
jgi:hypothetical protein